MKFLANVYLKKKQIDMLVLNYYHPKIKLVQSTQYRPDDTDHKIFFNISEKNWA